jgi:NAD(P)-dependent dehydrogenase (short-subunit alcohol dehydrogenase family)
MDEPTVLIMGTLTGIGCATALAFAKDGAPLISGCREAKCNALEAELRRLGAEAALIQADVRRDDEVSNRPSHGLGVSCSGEVPTTIEGMAADGVFGTPFRE